MSVAPQTHRSFVDWLAIERTTTDPRSEYVAGEVFAMAGGTEEHDLIVANLVRELGNQFKGRPCRVYESAMKVHIAAADVATYPDVMVICGERQFYDGRRDLVTNPRLIVEVLSESTEAYDRGDKFRHYRNLHSLRAYLLVSQYRVQAELFLRQPDGTWSLTQLPSAVGIHSPARDRGRPVARRDLRQGGAVEVAACAWRGLVARHHFLP